MVKTLSLFLVTGAVALVACSSTKNNSSGGSCSNYVSALQESAQRCKKSSDPPDTQAAAAARLTTLCTNALNAPGSGIAASAVDACANALRTSCDTPDACETLSNSAGTLADGTACGGDAQCQGGDCKKDSGSTGCGKCAQRIPVGGACGTSDANCASGSTCVAKGSASGTCVAKTKLAEGEVCYDPTKPASGGPATCATGLTCKVESGTAAGPIKCAQRGATGAACTSESDCVTELGCIAGKCGALLPDGAACTSSSNCAAGACATDTKKCVPYQYGAAGAACNNDEKRCARGSCSRTGGSSDGKCVDPIADGAPCTAASDSAGPRCDTYATCVNGTCQLFDPATCK